jgi:hypothetical protein
MAEEKTFTQEELDEKIQKGLAKQKEKLEEEFSKKYDGFVSPEDAKKMVEDAIANTKGSTESEMTKLKEQYEKENADLKAQVTKYEKDSLRLSIAKEFGIPESLASRLSGDDEETKKQDAENFAKALGQKPKDVAPLGKNQTGSEDGVSKKFYELNPDLKKIGGYEK